MSNNKESSSALLPTPIFAKKNIVRIKFDKELVFKRLTDKEIEGVFGISEVRRDAGGFIHSCNTSRIEQLFHPPSPYRVYFNSMYAFEYFIDEANWGSLNDKIQNLNFAICLILGPGFHVSFSRSKKKGQVLRSGSFFYPLPPHVIDKRVLSKKQILEIKRVYAKTNQLINDSKFKVMQQSFLHACSNDQYVPAKFLSLATILEMLFGDSDSSSVTYKISIRAAKILKKDYDFFRRIKDIYGKRSKLVHQGTRVSDEDFRFMSMLVHLSLYAYIANPFNSAMIDKQFLIK